MRYISAIAACALALLCTGCDQMAPVSSLWSSPHASAKQAPQQPQQNIFTARGECNTLAQRRMAMYDRPDTFPMSDKERYDAYLALYTECERDKNGQTALVPTHGVPVNETSASASQLSALSPAAGGNNIPHSDNTSTVNVGNTTVSSSSIPGATVVVIGGSKETAAQLSGLSPSSGGYSSNSTVVLMQPQNAATAMPGAYYTPGQPSAPLPVAVPVPPVAKGYMPASPASSASNEPLKPYTPPALLAGSGNATPAKVPPAKNATQELEDVLEK